MEKGEFKGVRGGGSREGGGRKGGRDKQLYFGDHVTAE